MPLFTEQFANAAVTTLSGSITSGSATLTRVVPVPDPFPASPQFRVAIDNEYLLVTGVSGNTWSVSRGVESSTASGHASGAVITHLLTAAGLQGVAGSVNLSDAAANLPATGNLGRLFVPADAHYFYQEQKGGWTPYGPIRPVSSPFPALSNWTPVNLAAGCTSGQAAGALRIFAPANAAGNGRLLTMAAPATGYTITALIVPELQQVTFAACGIGWRDSMTDKQAMIHWTGDTAGFDLQASYAPSSSGYFTAHYVNIASAMINRTNQTWFRIQDDGTNRTVSYSFNGFTFTQLDQRARNYYDGVSTINPDQVLLFVAPINAAAAAAVTLLSWIVTHP